jgi:hypothetical protein
MSPISQKQTADLQQSPGEAFTSRRMAFSDWLPGPFIWPIAGRLFASPWFARHVLLDR